MNVNVDIEKEINNEFIKQIEELPEEYKDPLENTIEYIKKRAVCSDYEAVQIQFLMSEQSAQKQGYKYYCKYIAGQSTPEEDNADYYKSIRKSWDKFLDKFANMSQDERIEAFQVHSGSEKALEILENADDDKLNFITEKTKSQLSNLETKANELKARSKTYLIKNLKYTKQIAESIEKDASKYFNSIIKAEIEYNTYIATDKRAETYSVDPTYNERIHYNADIDAVNVLDIINSFLKDDNTAEIKGVEKIEEGGAEFDFNSLKVSDMLQYHIRYNNDNCFKWYIIKKKCG